MGTYKDGMYFPNDNESYAGLNGNNNKPATTSKNNSTPKPSTPSTTTTTPQANFIGPTKPTSTTTTTNNNFVGPSKPAAPVSTNNNNNFIGPVKSAPAAATTPAPTTQYIKPIGPVQNSPAPLVSDFVPKTATPDFVGPSDLVGPSPSGGFIGPAKDKIVDKDTTIAEFQKLYQDAVSRDDIAGQIDAAEKADKYRVSIGQPAINEQLILGLKKKRTDKINKQIKVYQDAYQVSQSTNDIAGMLKSATDADNYRESVGEPRVNGDLIKDLTARLSGDQQDLLLDQPTLQDTEIPEFQSRYDEIMDQITQTLMDDILNPETSPYAGQIEKLLKQIQDSEFNYDPSKDTNLQNAINNTSKQVMEQLNRRGILNSTITQQDIAGAIVNLTASYGDLAYQKYTDGINRQFKVLDQIQQLDQLFQNEQATKLQKVQTLANYINGLDTKDYNIYKDKVDQYYKEQTAAIEAKKAALEEQRNQVKDAWERVKNLGYVDNEASIILGVAPNTLSKDIQDEMRKYEQDVAKMQKELEADLIKKQADYEIALSLQQTRDEASMAKEQYIQNQQNARTNATIAASKEKASTSKTAVKSEQTDYYNNFINEADSKDGESLYLNLKENEEEYLDLMGTSNYSKALKFAQNKYYEKLIDSWRDDYEGLTAELKRIPDYYKDVLGTNNYNKLMNLA